ncbi:MAG TPA: hypothetical protein VK810_04710, partial [Dongiaceae bacterium]|nr:hypothetical protein [Dongiaceae bacterium]
MNESKPDCRAGQQRVRKQQVQVLIHALKIKVICVRVKYLLVQPMKAACTAFVAASPFAKSMTTEILISLV